MDISVILEKVLNYGVLGIWTVWLLYQHKQMNERLITVVENNNTMLKKLELLLLDEHPLQSIKRKRKAA